MEVELGVVREQESFNAKKQISRHLSYSKIRYSQLENILNHCNALFYGCDALGISCSRLRTRGFNSFLVMIHALG
jgi:hypothetical protein